VADNQQLHTGIEETMQVVDGISEASISAVIIHCNCDNPPSHLGEPCPTGLLEELGVVSYYHKNPLKRLIWSANRKVFKKWQQ
jgi:hypothetical protein